MLQLMDCTLRDGANVVGKGFDEEITTMILEGLIDNGIQIIEIGNALGIGAYDKGSTDALTDAEYLKLAQPFTKQAQLGMFLGWKNGSREVVEQAADSGLSFLRVGANAGDGEKAAEVVRRVRSQGLFCRYAMMKAYIHSPVEAADEAKLLETAGVNEITIMDSAGTMRPDETEAFVKEMKKSVKIPIGFHGHNNLGLATANALSAYQAGADVIDSCLLGMARSAGNIALEIIAALLQERGEVSEINLFGLLGFLDKELIPAMRKREYNPPIMPVDLIYGLAGAHSSFSKAFAETARKYDVNLYQLIIEVSRIDRKAPDLELMEKTAKELRRI